MALPEQDFLVARVREARWRKAAACRNENMDSFFPNGRPPRSRKQICSECPVLKECLEWVLDSPWEPSGIWAGMDPRELASAWAERHRPEVRPRSAVAS